MKKVIFIYLIIASIFSFSACGQLDLLINEYKKSTDEIIQKLDDSFDVLDKKTDVPNSPEAKNALEFSGHRYLYIDTPMSWNDAKLYCEKLGGYLVSIGGSEENKFVSSLCKPDDSFWIGANLFAGFRWANGENNSYIEPFESGEPALGAIYVVSSADGFWTNLLERELSFVCEWGDYESDKIYSSPAGKFETIAEHKGKVYTGFEATDALHVGGSNETTKFYINDDYIYYYSFQVGHALGEGYREDDFTLWRCKLDGSDKIAVASLENPYNSSGNGIYVSDLYVINEVIYMSVSYYSDASNDIADSRVLCSVNISDVNTTASPVTMNSAELVNGAMQLVTAGGKYLIFLPYSEMDYSYPYDIGYVIYNTESEDFYFKDTAEYVNSAYIDGDYMYYNVGHGNTMQARRCDFTSGEDIEYISEDNSYSIGDDIAELEGEQRIKLESEKFWYAEEIAADFYGAEYYQINKSTLEKKHIGICRYPN